MPTESDSYSRNWQRLAKKFGKYPYFLVSLVIRQVYSGISLKLARYKAICFAFPFIAFGMGLFTVSVQQKLHKGIRLRLTFKATPANYLHYPEVSGILVL